MRKVSEWVGAWMSAQNNYNRFSAIIAYLDEQAAGRPCPPEAVPFDNACDRGVCTPHLTEMCGKHQDEYEANCVRRNFEQGLDMATGFVPAPASSPVEDKPVPPLPVAHQVTLSVMRERDTAQSELTRLKEDNARLAAELSLCRNERDAQHGLYLTYRAQAEGNDPAPAPLPGEGGPTLAPCTRCLAPHEAHDGIGGDSCGRCLALAEAQAELTRLKAALANAEQSLFHHTEVAAQRGVELAEAQTLLLAATNQREEAQRTIASLEAETMTLTSERDTARMGQDELRSELTWERGWDLLRKAQMSSVVNAARAMRDAIGLVWPHGKALSEALSALDQPSQPEPASEPDATSPAASKPQP